MAILNEFDLLASLLRYPTESYERDTDRCSELFDEECVPVVELLRDFFEQIRPLTVEAIEVLYTSTFDLNPICSLEVGWHLFGENYERGEFLVKMRGKLRKHGVDESTELPDHLAHALELLARMDQQEATDFATLCIVPALEKMRKAMENKSNPYELVLLAIERLLKLRYPMDESDMATAQPAFHILN